MKRVLAGLLPVLFLSSSASAACLLGCNWDPVGDLTHPDRIVRNTANTVEKAGQDVDRWRREGQANAAGVALEGWLNASRNSAYGTAQPIPPDIRAKMQHLFSPEVLNRVRFKVGDNGALNLGGLTTRYGDVDAITLIDVIVFTNWNGARTPSLWAHELTHVKQFQDWGTHSFAVQYVRDHNQVEAPAYAAGNNYREPAVAYQPPGYQNQGYQNQGYPNQAYRPQGYPNQGVVPGRINNGQNPPNIVQAQARVCYIQQMNNGCQLTTMTPVGGQCGCSTQWGPVYGYAQ